MSLLQPILVGFVSRSSFCCGLKTAGSNLSVNFFTDFVPCSAFVPSDDAKNIGLIRRNTNDTKLKYLKTLVTGKAKTAIEEFSYSGVMYKDALSTLQR